MSTALRAGVAQINITPPVGVDLSGFAGRAGGCLGVHDELRAKALWLENGEQRLCLVTADLIGLDAASVAEIREHVHAETGLPAAHLMISCSHTHSGPGTPCLPYLGEVDEGYFAVLKRKLVGLVRMAAAQQQQVGVAPGRTEVCVGVNRRERTPEGTTRLGRNPSGVLLPYVDVLRVQGEGTTPLAVLFTHAAHPVTLGGDNLLVTADYPGVAQEVVERAWGDDGRPTALFAQGCCGNINSQREPGTFEQARRLGLRLGGATVRATEESWRDLKADAVVLGSASEVAQLPLFDPPPVDEAEATLAQCRETAEANRDQANVGMRKTQLGLVGWAERVLDLSRQQAHDLTVPFEVHAVRVGDTAIVGLPGEIFIEYAISIAQASPFEHTLVLGYTNGNIGYLPTAAAYAEGGYEVETAYKYYGTLMHRPESEVVVLETAARVLHTVAD